MLLFLMHLGERVYSRTNEERQIARLRKFLLTKNLTYVNSPSDHEVYYRVADSTARNFLSKLEERLVKLYHITVIEAYPDTICLQPLDGEGLDLLRGFRREHLLEKDKGARPILDGCTPDKPEGLERLTEQTDPACAAH